VIIVQDLVLRVGARTLIEPVGFAINKGDRVGLVGRNGAGKTTLARVLAGEAKPDEGQVTISGTVGYLPQDPRESDPDMRARARILSGRGLDGVIRELEEAQLAMAGASSSRDLERYGRLENRFHALGGYAAEAEAASIAASLGLPERVLDQPLRQLSGGQRRRVELSRILFSGADNLLLDEPTNHLDADSILWLRDFLQRYKGTVVFISHDVDLLDVAASRIFHLDANRSAIDVYNVGWKTYQEQRETDDKRRKRERANAEKKASALLTQAAKLGAKATRAKQAHVMERRAEKLLSDAPELRRKDRTAHLRLPQPAPCGRVPLSATGLARSYGSLKVFRNLDLELERSSRTVVLGQNGAGKTTLLRVLAGLDKPDAGTVQRGYGLRLGYYAQEHETLKPERSVLDNMRLSAPGLDTVELRSILGSFMFSGPTVDQQVKTLSGGEKTRLALATLVVSGANVLLLDEPTNNLDPASRDEILGAIADYAGAVLLVTHDEGAVHALRPQRVVVMPEGISDYWDPSLLELVSLA
jgi:ATPase subunit of ABC transporter with duplicated ATPase domains